MSYPHEQRSPSGSDAGAESTSGRPRVAGRLAAKMGEREGLIARIRQVRRVSTAPEQPRSTETDAPQDGLRALQARVEHLEQQLEGLQDSVHRETERQTRLIAELQDLVRPESMGAALAEDARRRGL